ncbi:MAG: GxxExxY protein [Proteobacteria bacterium]|nr:GxxExxY protein [Pseudomonadota bacterium]MBU4100621.1 GxxExxY protein [Pseudomonadota bacterium]
MKDIEEIGRNIVHSAIKVHKALGPGLLESVYQKCLAYELEKKGLTVACEVPLPVKYESVLKLTNLKLGFLLNWNAYSAPFRPPIPEQIGHPFRLIPATNSGAFRPL